CKAPVIFYLSFAFLYAIIATHAGFMPNVPFRFRKAEGGDNISNGFVEPMTLMSFITFSALEPYTIF
ncbi:hypothetical protein, partial [Flexistipes sinusarabici]|uniref:hypothetical protein n=1 Tax=Flexistipes sinusarabici TaxID=2352 RepID=UPI0026EF49E7